MGFESLRPRQTFGLEELGLLETTPLKSIDTIVRLFSAAIQVSTVSFFVFDDCSAGIVVRSVQSNVDQRTGWINRGNSTALCSVVRDERELVGINDLTSRDDLADAIERRRYGAASYLGAPVLGPHGEVAGVLSAMTSVRHFWTLHDRELVSDHAFLLSEQIMLGAALQTLKLMARERDVFCAVN